MDLKLDQIEKEIREEFTKEFRARAWVLGLISASVGITIGVVIMSLLAMFGGL